MIRALQIIDRRGWRKGAKPTGLKNMPLRTLLGPVLYLSVIVFNLTVAFVIGERLMALTGLFIFTLPIAMAVRYLSAVPTAMAGKSSANTCGIIHGLPLLRLTIKNLNREGLLEEGKAYPVYKGDDGDCEIISRQPAISAQPQKLR